MQRQMSRPQAQDVISQLFSDFEELVGDGKVGRDACIRGGLASFQGAAQCVVIATFKGHSPGAMQDSNFGMASPHGYRTALRLMDLAERFGLPVFTLIDTVGAWPTFASEASGQSEAIATNLTKMAGLTVPIITLEVGEGGSGGALGIGMGNSVGMLSGGYFGVISPEGAASILGRYPDEASKAERFPLDCQELALAQHIYADQLRDMGVVDEIIWEHVRAAEDGEEEGVTEGAARGSAAGARPLKRDLSPHRVSSARCCTSLLARTGRGPRPCRSALRRAAASSPPLQPSALDTLAARSSAVTTSSKEPMRRNLS